LSEKEVVTGREEAEKRATRMLLTDVIQKEVETLGRSVSGPQLGRIAPPPAV